VPDITLSDGSSLNISSEALTPTLKQYLKQGVDFVFGPKVTAIIEAPNKAVGDVDAEKFPVSLAPKLPSSSFSISSATLNLQPSFSASIDVLTGEKAAEFTASLGPNFSPIPALVSFAFTAELDSGPSGGVGDFSFGLTSGQEIEITNSCAVDKSELLKDAVKQTISGLTLPHDLEDLRGLPEGHICALEGQASVRFTAAVAYSFLNNTLATAPVEVFSKELDVKVSSGATLQVSVSHTNTHRLTVASLGNNVVRLAVSLAEEAEVGESFDISLGASGNIGNTDALTFVVKHLSGNPDKELAQVNSFLSDQDQSDLSAQIKSVLEGATKAGITASLTEALKQSQQDKSLFIYDVDLKALDGESGPAVESALKGNFTNLTALGSALAGIKEVKSVETLTSARSHTLTLHLLGLLNFSDVSTFLKRVKIARLGDTSDVVMAATDIKVVQNTVDPDHLREVLTKSAMITSAADSSPDNPDYEYQMVFFLKRAGIKSSDLRQMANSLAFVSSPDAEAASALLRRASSRPDVLVYFALKLNKDLSVAIFQTPDRSAYRGTDDFVKAGQRAMAAILADDPDSEGRMPVFSLDLNSWKELRTIGAAQAVRAALAEKGITHPAAWTDFASIDWWAQAMGKMAAALQGGKPLGDAQKEVLKDSQAGFDIPWALLATSSLLSNSSALKDGLPVRTKLSVSGAQVTAAA
jgi:hypothetical protein